MTTSLSVHKDEKNKAENPIEFFSYPSHSRAQKIFVKYLCYRYKMHGHVGCSDNDHRSILTSQTKHHRDWWIDPPDCGVTLQIFRCGTARPVHGSMLSSCIPTAILVLRLCLHLLQLNLNKIVYNLRPANRQRQRKQIERKNLLFGKLLKISNLYSL